MTETPATPPTTSDPPLPVWEVSTILKGGAAAFLAVSVLVLAAIGKVPVDTYLTLIVVPGLSILGLHTAAKTLT
jgi:hypothetical protein